MHTATRIAVAAALPRIRALAPSAHVCMYGLYAAMNERLLRDLGVQTLWAANLNLASSPWPTGCAMATATCSAGRSSICHAWPSSRPIERDCPSWRGTLIWYCRVAVARSRALLKRHAAASMCAVTARWSRCTKGSSARWTIRGAGGHRAASSGDGRSTYRIRATRIFSTGRLTRSR